MSLAQNSVVANIVSVSRLQQQVRSTITTINAMHHLVADSELQAPFMLCPEYAFVPLREEPSKETAE